MQNKIEEAKQLATEAHKNQIRKFSGCPYITHPIRVAERVKTLKGSTETMIIAAILHDTLEDTETTYQDLQYNFGDKITDLVIELTNSYTKNNFPNLNRKERQKLEHKRIATISREAKIIKLIDRIDNLREMPIDEGFLRRYISESKDLLEVLRGVHQELEDELENLIGELDGRLK